MCEQRSEKIKKLELLSIEKILGENHNNIRKNCVGFLFILLSDKVAGKKAMQLLNIRKNMSEKPMRFYESCALVAVRPWYYLSLSSRMAGKKNAAVRPH